MSFGATKWAKSLRNLTGTEKAVLLVIADYFNEEAKNENDDTKYLQAWPSRKTIANETGFSVRTVSRTINRLNRYVTSDTEERLLIVQRWVDIDTGRHYSNHYFLPLYNPKSGEGQPKRRTCFNTSSGGDFELEVYK